MLLVIWILRVLAVLMLVRFVMRLLGARPATRGHRSATRPPERLGGTLVRDPQCGTFIPREHAPSIGQGDQAVYFCSTACRDLWAEAHRP